MRILETFKYRGVYTFTNAPKPKITDIWAVKYRDLEDSTISSIPEDVIHHCQEISESRWAGWTFEQQTLQPYLLFSDPTDAMLAEIIYSGQEE